jgi:hypothetical protein
MEVTTLNPTDWLTEVGGPNDRSVVLGSSPFPGGANRFLDDVKIQTGRRSRSLEDASMFKILGDGVGGPWLQDHIKRAILNRPGSPVLGGFCANIPSVIQDLIVKGPLTLVQLYPELDVIDADLVDVIENTTLDWLLDVATIHRRNLTSREFNHHKFLNHFHHYMEVMVLRALKLNYYVNELPTVKEGQSLREWGDEIDLEAVSSHELLNRYGVLTRKCVVKLEGGRTVYFIGDDKYVYGK